MRLLVLGSVVLCAGLYKLTFVQPGFVVEIEQSRDGWTENVCIENTGANSTSSERKGEICYRMVLVSSEGKHECNHDNPLLRFTDSNPIV